MSNNPETKGLSSFDFFTIGFGAIVGVGWALSLNNWMANSGGPIPAAIGYLMVLVILTPVALCYCELTPMLPVAGGGMAFAYRAFNETVSFISGWAAFGAFVSIIPWEAIQITDVLGYLIPNIKAGDPLYQIAGTDVYLVTIIIGTIMIAMALGNIYGGKSADKSPNPDKLYGRILIAAIWIALIPVVGKYIILGISALLIFTVSNNFLIIAAFAACMVIFVFPLFLLGTVTPSLVKYSVDSLDDSGQTVGTLGAFNTVGSIIGTFVPTFVTIPAVGTSITFLIFSGILILLSVIYFICQHTGKKKIAASVLIFILCCGLGYSDSFAFWQKDLTYEGESIYNYLQVSETDRQVVLSTNVLFGVQSLYMKEGGLTGMYYDYAMAAPLMVPDKPVEDMDVLILGMGTGTYATQCRKYFGDMNIEGVEIDEKITELSREYFSLPEDVKVTTYDGRAFLQAVDTTYDVIMVDAYQDITIPFQMSSVEFFTMVKDHLKDGGVMVVNMNMHGNKEGDINQYLADTIANVFDNVYTVDVAGSTNRELFASQHSDMIEVLSDHVENLSDAGLQNMMQRVADNSSAYVTGDYLMTDDKAPVELLGMQVIDQLIQEEVAYYKDIYEEQGISGLMEHL